MKYSYKYPGEVLEIEEIQDAYGTLLKCQAEGECFHCKEKTKFIDLDFEGHICSEECLQTENKFYFDNNPNEKEYAEMMDEMYKSYEEYEKHKN